MATIYMRKCVVLMLFCLLFVFHIEHAFGSIVSSEAGSIEGVLVPFPNGNVYQFKGIPYAKPPVGPLRFSKPVKQPPWSDTLNATEYKPGCIQSDPGNLPTSEDCLFLNVYVPSEVSAIANKTVMVWIHGGGYTSGAGSLYDGSFLALHGDVIVVTLNYRLGVLGFFSTGDANARGNYGLWDQIEALKWVKSNIRNFGGNPDSVTLFGESAGAFSVSHLAIMPSNKGLFHRVIMQSGSLGSFGSVIRYPADAASNFGSFLQCSGSDNSELLLTCLRGISTVRYFCLKVYYY
ncbi:pyrethroid hydrolase Ces2e-like [Argopecten irradians]|uniref:pyrethroid hydrolase Ces2e-like n=1 Tax=Argopecten irradians TaxID=31199 RepID=UPI003722E750